MNLPAVYSPAVGDELVPTVKDKYFLFTILRPIIVTIFARKPIFDEKSLVNVEKSFVEKV